MANSGVLGGGGYQGRYLEVAWQLISQDIASNTSYLYWRVTAVGGTSSYYYHYRDYVDAFGEVLVNSNTRTKRYKGNLAEGYKTIYHDVNGNASFGAHVVAAVYSSGVNEDVSYTWALPQIPRQANITNLPASFTDEENPWFDYTNPGNFNLECWLEPNPSSPALCRRTFSGTGGRYTWNLTEAERKQLRQACKGNSCIMRIGLWSNNMQWASYHDRTFIIKDPMPIAGIPTWKTVNHLDLVNNTTVIKGYSNVAVTMPTATPVKEATIKQYKVIVGDKIASGTASGVFNLEGISDSIIKVYVEDSRGNTIEKILNITNYKLYEPPVITALSLSRSKGGIGSSVTLTYGGNFWNNNFGKLNNSLTVQYFYKTQGGGTWRQGTTSIVPKISDTAFGGEFEIAGDLGANGFDVGKNYDIKLVATDRLADVEKTTILTSGVPNMAIHRSGVAFGSFYDPSVGGPLQVEGKNILDYFYPVGAQIYNSNKNFDPNEHFSGTTWVRIKGDVLAGINEEDGDTSNPRICFNNVAGTQIGSKWLQNHNHPQHVATGINGGDTYYRFSFNGEGNGLLYASMHNTADSGNGNAQNIQPTRLTYIWERTA